MRKSILAFLFCVLAGLQSCYIEDTTPCIPIVTYQTQRCYSNYPYPVTVEVYFYERCQNYGTRYSLLVQDNLYGTQLINGRFWRYVSAPYRYSPIVAYADFIDLAPSRTYRALIISEYGTLSQEFTLYTY